MSAELKFGAIVMLLLVHCTAGSMEFPYMVDDPLQTRLEALRRRDMFLGDQVSQACAAANSDAQNFQKPVELITVVDLALCLNPQVRTAWAAIKVQAAGLGEARSTYVPTLNVTKSYLQNSTRFSDGLTPDTHNSGSTQYINLVWRIFDFGTRSANVASAQQQLAAALASHDATLQKMLTSVVAAYFDAMTAQATFKARGQAVELAMGTWQATSRREAKGVAAASDTLQAGAALAKARLAMSRAQGDLKRAQSVLLYAMGLSMEFQLVLPEDNTTGQAERNQALSEWLMDAQQLHPAIRAARAQLAASKAKLQATQAEGLPSLDVIQNQYQNGYPNQGLSPTSSKINTTGITLNVPLFEGFARTYKVKGALAQSQQSESQLQDTESQVLMEVVKAHADMQSTFDNVQVSQQLLDAAQAAMQSSQKRYDKGAADVLELLATQNALTDAQQERVRCLSEWRSARLRLLSSAGVLGRDGVR